MSSRRFAQIVGVVYLLVGVLGLFGTFVVPPPAEAPPLNVSNGYGYLFGLFPVNLLHNFVHLGIGAWALLASRSEPSSRSFSRALAVLYGALAIMGLIPGLHTLFGLAPLFGHDIWLHAVTAAVAAYFGFAERRVTADPGVLRS